MTRIAIFGAGAIGGMIAAMLCKAGEADVSVVARGAQLDAIASRGLTLKKDGVEFTVHPRAAAGGAALGAQDYVVLALKAHGIAPAIALIKPLLGPDTAILYAQNGLPWWYFHRHGGPYDGRRLESVDPGGWIWNELGPERAIGAVVWQSAELIAPGVVAHGYGGRMPIAEPSGEKSARVQLLSKLLTAAGLKSPVRPALRNEIWLKLWGNLSFNPVSVLTGGTLEAMARDGHARAVIGAMMAESKAVAEKLGVTFAVSIDERIAMAEKVGAHRTSMLQDIEAGKATELDALLGAVIELAGMTGIAAPALKLVYDLVKFREARGSA